MKTPPNSLRLPTATAKRSLLFIAALLFFTWLFITSIRISAASSKPIVASPKATKLAQKSIIIDGHIDVPYRLEKSWADVTKASESGDFDYPRAKQGGLNAPFMSIYITAFAHKLIDYMEALVGRAPAKFAIATSPKEVEAQFAKGLVSLPLGMENGSPIQGDLKNLEMFYQRGIRYITLTHAKSNHISDSSYDENHQWGGLSSFGKTLIREMNSLGIMIDVSHVSDAAFYDVLKETKVPVIASHSSLRHFTPGFERNMGDAMLKALSKNKGIIMINFGTGFLTRDARDWSKKRADESKKIDEKYGRESPQSKTFAKTYRDKNPYPFANIQNVVDHINYAVKLVGVDHVGLGSDYDGVGDSLPNGLKDASSYPNLVQGLLDAGYSDTDIVKILGGNILRVWREVEHYAIRAAKN